VLAAAPRRSWPVWRGSPESVETSVLVISPVGAGLLVPACGWCRPVAWPLFLLPGAAVVSGVKGGPQGDAEHPGGRRGGPVPLAGARSTAAAQPPPFPGPRSGPAAVTRRPFPPATARNPRGCARRARNAGGRGCSPRSTPPPQPALPPWWRTCAVTQLELQGGVPEVAPRVNSPVPENPRAEPTLRPR
jgi:hypothetical protein